MTVAPLSPPSAEADPRWHRIVARDPTADGLFWYSVRTTGVFCRPSCPSRTANPKNVELHDTIAEARRTGFRPCRRCRPEGPTAPEMLADRVAAACRLIEGSVEIVPLAELAAKAALSPGAFHRQFKAVTGLTPRAYAKAHRARTVRDTLGSGQPVTRSFHEAGFGSSGRFYEEADAILGMKPSRYRAGGPGEEIRFAVGACSLGAILAASSRRGVVAILLGDDPDGLVRDLQDRFSRARLIGDDPSYAETVATVVGLVEHPSRGHGLPLDIRGTAFQQRVWQALAAIPPGRTASYSEIAVGIGSPSAVRAVAGACAANPLAVAVPCHRVVRSDGTLSGYAWGIARKRTLLAREQEEG